MTARLRTIFLAAILTFGSLAVASPASAHVPRLNEGQAVTDIGDPTSASTAIYGSLLAPGQTDLYVFMATKDEELPIHVLVPFRPSLQELQPVVIVEKSGGETVLLGEAPPLPGSDQTYYEEFSQEKYRRGAAVMAPVKAGERYVIVVSDPTGRTGDYVLGIGTVENFKNVDFGGLLIGVARLKLGAIGGKPIPWPGIIGLFLTMVGGIMVLAAAAAMRIRPEKRPRAAVIAGWVAFTAAAIGSTALYWPAGLSGTAAFQLLAGLTIVGGQTRLSFKYSSRPAAVALVAGWLIFFFLLSWHLMMLR